MEPFLRGCKAFKGGFFLTGFKHEQHLGSPPFTAGSVLMHLFHLSRQLYTHFTVRYMNSQCVPEPEEPEAFAQACRDLIGRWSGLKTLKSTAEDKDGFMVFFNTGVKERKTRVGQGGRAISGEAGGMKGQDHAELRNQRLAAKKEALKDQEEDEEDEDSDSD